MKCEMCHICRVSGGYKQEWGASPGYGRDSAETCLQNTAAAMSSEHVTEYSIINMLLPE